MIKSTSIIIILLVLFGFEAHSQFANQEEYQAWLDSLAKENYIANTILLEEVNVLSRSGKEKDFYEYLRGNPMNSVDDFVHHLPGMNMSRKGNYASEPMMRGMDINRLEVNIDGMRIKPACTDRMDPVTSYMEPNNMATLELEKGSEGFKSASSTGHGLNFTTKSPVFDRSRQVKGMVGLKYGTVANEFSQMGDVNWNSKGSAVRFNFVNRWAGNYYGGEKTLVENSGFNKLNFSLGYSQQIGESDLIKIHYIQDEAWDIGYPALPMDVSRASAKMLSGTYLRSFGAEKRNSMDVKFYYNTIVHIMDDSKREDVVMHMDMPGETQTIGTIFSTRLVNQKGNSINTKVELYNSYSFAEMTMYPEGQSSMYMQTWPGIRQYGFSVGVDGKAALSSKTRVSAGLRLEVAKMYMEEDFGISQFDVFGKENTEEEFTPLPTVFLGLDRKLGSKSNLGIRGSYGVRMPNNSEKFGFYIFNSTDRFDYVGDPEIQPENSFKLDLEYTYQSSRFTFKVTQFNYYFTNYILGVSDTILQAMTPGAQGVKTYSNTSNASLNGIELFSQFELSPKTGLIATINYSHGNDYEGEPLPFIPPFKMMASTYSRLKLFTIQPEVVYAAAQNRVSEKNIESSTPSFWLFNFKISKDYQFNNKRLRGVVGIENIFDNLYREHIDWGGIPRPGRNIFVDLSFSF